MSDDMTLRHDAELELVKNALWSDPADQSAWLYHRWLIGNGTLAARLFRGHFAQHASGEDKAVLQAEVEGIRELLMEQPDSKCACMHYLLAPLADHRCAGCMESLVHYNLLNQSSTPEKESTTECSELLVKLVKIDPMRQNRYKALRMPVFFRCSAVCADTCLGASLKSS